MEHAKVILVLIYGGITFCYGIFFGIFLDACIVEEKTVKQCLKELILHAVKTAEKDTPDVTRNANNTQESVKN